MLKELRARAGVSSFLSRHNSNPKIAKAEKLLGVRTAVLHLAPGKMSGIEVCQSRSPGCTAACLHFAGRPFTQTQKDKTRIRRTRFLFEHRNDAFALLHHEINAHAKRALRDAMTAAVRLNGTSDLPWERMRGPFGTIIDAFPEVQFYDYTAVISRLRQPLPANYHLTFSLKEDNLAHAIEAMQRGFNVAAVFPKGEVPTHFLGRPVVNGDEHDYRPADPPASIVGLEAKGVLGYGDTSGFVLRTPDLAVAA